MKNNKPTLAIYGIKDRYQTDRPSFIHDHNICLMQNGKILQYLQLERFTRRKYDNRLDEFIEDLIDNKLLNLPDDFDLVNVNVFAGNSFISKSGRLRVESNLQKELKPDLEEAKAWFQSENLKGKVGFISMRKAKDHTHKTTLGQATFRKIFVRSGILTETIFILTCKVTGFIPRTTCTQAITKTDLPV